MNKTTDKLAGAADTVRPYVERALKDDQLRENVRSAFMAAKDVYEELLAQGHLTRAASRAATDSDIHDNVRRAVDDLRDATRRLQGEKTQGEEKHATRNTTLLLTGIALGILFNPVTGPATRARLKEAILGPADELEYPAPNEDGPASSDDGA
jgi:gas vesicle protein